MRTPLLLASILAATTACGSLDLADPSTGELATPTTGGGSSGGTSVPGTQSSSGGTTNGGSSGGGTTGGSSGGGTGLAGPGGHFSGINAANSTSNCLINQAQLDSLVQTWTTWSWSVSIGGPVDPALGLNTGTSPFDIWGAQVDGDLMGFVPAQGFSAAFEMSASNVVTIDPAMQQMVPITQNQALGYGLNDAYFEAHIGELLPYTAADTNFMLSPGLLTITVYAAVDGGTLVGHTIDGSLWNSALELNFGDATWDGDLTSLGYICSVWLDLNGKQVSSN